MAERTSLQDIRGLSVIQAQNIKWYDRMKECKIKSCPMTCCPEHWVHFVDNKGEIKSSGNTN